MKKFVVILLALNFFSISVTTNACVEFRDDVRDYYTGGFVANGFDSAVQENYSSNVSITINMGHFLNIEIDHKNKGTYYGHITRNSKDKVTIDYWNTEKQKHSATCNVSNYVSNDVNNFPKFECFGSLLGNMGGDGKFTITKRW